MKGQPESTTQDLEDAGDQGDRGDADDEDMKGMGAVNEEPVITIGVDGEKWDDSEHAEENSASKTELGWINFGLRQRVSEMNQRTAEKRQRISKTRTRSTS